MDKYFVKAILLLILLINIIVFSITLKFFINKINISSSLYLGFFIFAISYIIFK